MWLNLMVNSHLICLINSTWHSWCFLPLGLPSSLSFRAQHPPDFLLLSDFVFTGQAYILVAILVLNLLMLAYTRAKTLLLFLGDLVVLNTIFMILQILIFSPNFSPKSHTHMSNCLLVISIQMCNNHLKHNMYFPQMCVVSKISKLDKTP